MPQQTDHEQINTSHLRVDAAHAMTNAPSDSASHDLMPAGVRHLESLEQLDLHASQLATRLQSKQAELDRREIQLNAQVAQLENELRQARLWSQEQSYSISEREVELGGRTSSSTAQRPTAIDRSIEEGLAELDRRDARLQTREAAADKREQTLLKRETELDEREAKLSEIEIEQRSAEYLRDFAITLDRDADELREANAKLRQEATAFAKHVEAKEQALVDARETLDQEHRERTTLLLERQEEIEKNRASLENVRSELNMLHHESLEMRLVAQEVWRRLCRDHDANTVERMVRESQERVAESFRTERNVLCRQREEIQTAVEALDRQRQLLVDQKANAEQWSSRLEAELERQADKIISRERSLDEREAKLQRTELKDEDDRAVLKRQIRQLKATLANAADVIE